MAPYMNFSPTSSHSYSPSASPSPWGADRSASGTLNLDELEEECLEYEEKLSESYCSTPAHHFTTRSTYSTPGRAGRSGAAGVVAPRLGAGPLLGSCSAADEILQIAEPKAKSPQVSAKTLLLEQLNARLLHENQRLKRSLEVGRGRAGGSGFTCRRRWDDMEAFVVSVGGGSSPSRGRGMVVDPRKPITTKVIKEPPELNLIRSLDDHVSSKSASAVDEEEGGDLPSHSTLRGSMGAVDGSGRGVQVQDQVPASREPAFGEFKFLCAPEDSDVEHGAGSTNIATSAGSTNIATSSSRAMPTTSVTKKNGLPKSAAGAPTRLPAARLSAGGDLAPSSSVVGSMISKTNIKPSYAGRRVSHGRMQSEGQEMVSRDERTPTRNASRGRAKLADRAPLQRSTRSNGRAAAAGRTRTGGADPPRVPSPIPLKPKAPANLAELAPRTRPSSGSKSRPGTCSGTTPRRLDFDGPGAGRTIMDETEVESPSVLSVSTHPVPAISEKRRSIAARELDEEQMKQRLSSSPPPPRFESSRITTPSSSSAGTSSGSSGFSSPDEHFALTPLRVSFPTAAAAQPQSHLVTIQSSVRKPSPLHRCIEGNSKEAGMPVVHRGHVAEVAGRRKRHYFSDVAAVHHEINAVATSRDERVRDADVEQEVQILRGLQGNGPNRPALLAPPAFNPSTCSKSTVVSNPIDDYDDVRRRFEEGQKKLTEQEQKKQQTRDELALASKLIIRRKSSSSSGSSTGGSTTSSALTGTGTVAATATAGQGQGTVPESMNHGDETRKELNMSAISGAFPFSEIADEGAASTDEVRPAPTSTSIVPRTSTAAASAEVLAALGFNVFPPHDTPPTRSNQNLYQPPLLHPHANSTHPRGPLPGDKVRTAGEQQRTPDQQEDRQPTTQHIQQHITPTPTSTTTNANTAATTTNSRQAALMKDISAMIEDLGYRSASSRVNDSSRVKNFGASNIRQPMLPDAGGPGGRGRSGGPGAPAPCFDVPADLQVSGSTFGPGSIATSGDSGQNALPGPKSSYLRQYQKPVEKLTEPQPAGSPERKGQREGR